MLKRTATLALVLISILLAACGGGSSSPTTAAGSPLTVKQVWVRAAPASGMSAAYFTIVSGQVAADELTAVSTPVAGMSTIHETTSDASGMTGMSPVASVVVPGGGTVAFEPGGYHVMLEGLTQELKVGDSVQLVLTFKIAGRITVTAEVRAS